MGRPLTPEERIWLDALRDDTPSKSIERLDGYGKFLFGTVTTVGTLLAAFNIFGPENLVTRSRWLLLPVALSSLSLALATLGITPATESVNASDLESIRKYYNSLLRKRGRYISWAGITFALSLASVAAVFLIAMPRSSHFVSMTFSGVGDKVMLTARVEIGGQPAGSSVSTLILGFQSTQTNAQPIVIFEDKTQLDQSGDLKLSPRLDDVSGLRKFLASVQITVDGKVTYHQEQQIIR